MTLFFQGSSQDKTEHCHRVPSKGFIVSELLTAQLVKVRLVVKADFKYL